MKIWGLGVGLKNIRKVNKLFCNRRTGLPRTAANVYVCELGRTDRYEKVVERGTRCWQRLWDMDEMSLLGDALKTAKFRKKKEATG